MGINILSPDVNDSYRDFRVVGEAIRFGLAAVKNVGDGAIEAIIEETLEPACWTILAPDVLRGVRWRAGS